MYRIEVATGEATVFRTVEELATGIRNGLITPSSRIWHGASQKWLPIDIHPHYKKALDLVTGGAPMIDTGLRPSPRRTPPPAPAPRRPEHRTATASPTPAPPPRPPEHRALAPSPAPLPAPRPSELRAVAPPPPAPRPPEPRAVAPAPAPIVPAAPTPPPVPPGPAPSVSADFPPSSGLPRLSPWPFGAPPVTERHQPAQQESAVLTAPAPAKWDAVDAPVAVAPGEVALPTITYPEVPEPLPAELFQPVARRRPGGRTSFMLGGIVAVAIVGGVFALRSKQSAGFAAEPPRAQEQVSAPAETESEFGGEAAFPDEPVPESAPVKSAVSAPAPAPALQPVSARAHGAAPAVARPPATSVFTPAPRPTGPVSQAWSASAGAIAPTAPPPSPSAAATPADAPAISPPPAAIDLALPRLPSAETIGVAAEAKRDSATMKRILRAVSGRAAGGKSAQ